MRLLLLSVLVLAACNNPVPPPVPPPTQHSVTLTWGVPSPAESYVVSRADCLNFIPESSPTAGSCAEAGAFQDLATTTLLNYTDTTVAVGQSYAYTITAKYSQMFFTSNIVAALISTASSNVHLKLAPALPAGRVR